MTMLHDVPSIHLLQWVAPLLLAVLASSALAQRAERPDIKVGDRWKYEQRDRRTGGVEGQYVRVVTAVTATHIEGTENDGKFLMTIDMNQLESPTNSNTDPKYLDFPLEVGKKWEFKNKWTNKTRVASGRDQLDIVVSGYEKVTVPAGEFDAFKIEAKGFWNNDTSRSNGRTIRTYWFAPAAKAVVKFENDDGYNRWVRELTELQLQQ